MSISTTAARTALAEAIAALGVTDMFGVVGEDLVLLLAAIVDDTAIAYHPSRHESAAVCMAQGYARASGRLGVCIVSTGPGFTNAMTGLVQSAKAGAPVLVLVGGVAPGSPEPTAGVAAAKYVAQDELARAAGIDLLHLTAVEDAAGVLSDAAALAAGGRPVIVQISLDLAAPASVGLAPPQPPGAPERTDGPAASPEAIERAAALLAGARRPLIVAGRGADRAGARDALIALADHSGALLGTSVLGGGLFADEPSTIGLVGGFSHGPGRTVVEQADCVVAFGASLNMFTTGLGRLFTVADVCQFTLDPAPTGLARPPVIAEHCDARRAAEQLTAALSGRETAAAWPADLRAAVRGYRPATAIADRSGPRGADPEALLCALDEALPRRRNVVLDGGHFTGHATMYLRAPDPSRFFYGLDFASVGVGHPTGLGVAVARPGELVVVVVGDGGLLMTLGELDVARELALPILIVVMNDAAYGAEVHFLGLRGIAGEVARLPPQDFAAIAAGMGIASAAVHTPAQAADAVRAAGVLDRPLLLDCRIDPQIRAGWLEELYR